MPCEPCAAYQRGDLEDQTINGVLIHVCNQVSPGPPILSCGLGCPCGCVRPRRKHVWVCTGCGDVSQDRASHVHRVAGKSIQSFPRASRYQDADGTLHETDGLIYGPPAAPAIGGDSHEVAAWLRAALSHYESWGSSGPVSEMLDAFVAANPETVQ